MIINKKISMARKPKIEESNKEIVALNDFEHTLMRPTMYVGSVERSEEKIQIISDGKIIEKTKIISVGFYKLLNEIVDNAFDEAKRMKGEMPRITVKINSSNNEVIVIDTGGGFINADKANSKTGQSNVETAMSMLRAGSNFFNDTSEETLIGTNGVGAALVNMLSDEFSITTVNSEICYTISWNKFVKDSENTVKKKSLPTGTTVKFKPRTDIFKDCTWDKEYLHTLFTFKQYLKNHDAAIENLELELYFDGELLDLNQPFLPKNCLVFKTKIGQYILWDKFEESTSASFINGALCVGIHQKILSDWVNEVFDYNLAHHFYESLLILNLSPKLVKFGDQNKTRYVAGRWEIQHLLEKEFLKRVKNGIPRSEFYEIVKKKIDERNLKQDLNTVKSKKKAAAKKISDKYFPPSASRHSLWIVEGQCLDENTLIYIFRDGEKMILPIKDVLIGDEVITHKHRFKEIVEKQKKLKQLKKITLSNGEIINASDEHRFYVYNTVTNKFSFEKVKDLNLAENKFVKSRLSKFINNVEVIDAYQTNSNFKYGLLLETGEVYENTEYHKYCVFNVEDQSFVMKFAKDIQTGDVISNFEEYE